MKMKKDNYFNISNKITINAKTNEINKSNKWHLYFPFLAFYLREFGFSTWNFLTSYKIMSIYNSQFNWRRKLHVIFSGYSYCNSYIKVELK